MYWRLFADLATVAGDRRVELSGEPETVGDALEALLESRPELASRVRTETGEIEPHINVLLDGTNVSEDLDTPIDQDAELALFPPVSGG